MEPSADEHEWAGHSLRIAEVPDERGARVLVVEDEDDVRIALGRILERSGYDCTLVADATEAHELLDHESFDIALCDLRLRGESGVELVRHVLTEHPSVAALVATGRDEPALAESLFELGAYGYLVKPFSPSQLLIDVASALQRRREGLAQRRQVELLERASAARQEELLVAIADIDELSSERHTALEDTVACLARAVELRDGGKPEHSEDFGAGCARLAAAVGLEPDRCEQIRLASQLHDVGKLALPEPILRKPGPLDPEERAVIEEHPLIGYRILSSSRLESLQLASTIALAHHERFDGTGYPNGLAGNEIPFEARIVSVVDVFDALVSDRPYRPALPLGEALLIMASQRGGAFDPQVLDTFLAQIWSGESDGEQT